MSKTQDFLDVANKKQREIKGGSRWHHCYYFHSVQFLQKCTRGHKWCPEATSVFEVFHFRAVFLWGTSQQWEPPVSHSKGNSWGDTARAPSLAHTAKAEIMSWGWSELPVCLVTNLFLTYLGMPKCTSHAIKPNASFSLVTHQLQQKTLVSSTCLECLQWPCFSSHFTPPPTHCF